MHVRDLLLHHATPASGPGFGPQHRARHALPGPEATARIVYPRLAQAWARTLVMYWSRLEHLGAVDLAQPLYVLDLAPGDGTLARGMLKTLAGELQAHGMLGWLLRYVACTLDGAAAEDPWADTDLEDWAARGFLHRGSWHPRTGRPLLLGADRFPLFGARNPAVALCAGGCPQGPESLGALVDALADFSAGRYLLLAADDGAAVDFDALAARQQDACAHAANLHCAGFELVLHVACRDDLAPLDDPAWEGLLRCADAGHPADRWLLAPGLDGPAAARLAWLLRGCGHDPGLLPALVADALAEDPEGLLAAGPEAIGALRRELARCWQELAPSGRADSLRAPFADLLLRLGELPLAREVLADTRAGNVPALDLLRGRLALATAHTDDALRYLRRYREHCPEDDAARVLQRAARARRRRAGTSRWQPAQDLRDGKLALELLDGLYLAAWMRERCAPAIGAAAWNATPPARARHAGADYALVHADLGLVGGAGVDCLEGMAWVHCWIAAAHEGQGFGARALRLLAASLRAAGLAHAFTSADPADARAQSVLARAGFERAPPATYEDLGGLVLLHLPLHDVALPGAPAPAPDALRRLVRSVAAPRARHLARAAAA